MEYIELITVEDTEDITEPRELEKDIVIASISLTKAGSSLPRILSMLENMLYTAGSILEEYISGNFKNSSFIDIKSLVPNRIKSPTTIA
ncbi:hypothetical protein GCM10008903_11350 [Clostridium cadaveris]